MGAATTTQEKAPEKVARQFQLPRHLHKQLKLAAVEDGRSASAIVTELVERFLSTRKPR